MKTRTLAMVKPGAVARGDGPMILHIAQSIGKIIGLRAFHFHDDEIGDFYEEHRGKDFFPRLIAHGSEGTSWIFVIEAEGPEGDNEFTARTWREKMGATDPRKAAPTTIRGLYGEEMPDNAVHGSANAVAAENEIAFFNDLVDGDFWDGVGI